MSISDNVLKNEERAIYSLRSLYREYGYSLYKVSKFEEYDLYAHNKSFLVSQNILSFTDTNGKLLALKPDVTLSIIKNIPDGDICTHKLCYNETVYRTSADSDGFREIMQTGLECIGNIDTYSESEVILLAMKSLETISSEYILDISHMGLIEGLLSELGVDDAQKAELIKMIESKNVHSIKAFCQKKNIDGAMVDKLCFLTELYLPISQALPKIKNTVVGDVMGKAYDSLVSISNVMKDYGIDDKLYIDFSIVNDVNYYDGVCFKGFINGIPDSVLSGGRYDKLLYRLGKRSGAIGFAVYLDRLERFESDTAEYDVDAVLIYDEGTDIRRIAEARSSLAKEYKRVLVGHAPDSSQKWQKIFKLTDRGIESLENND